jgi:hypothetical protein
MSSHPAPQHPLAQALRVCARSIYPDEAAVELIIGHGTFLHRGDFTQHITIGEYGPYGDKAVHAAIDWTAASTPATCPAPAGNGEYSASHQAWPPGSR